MGTIEIIALTTIFLFFAFNIYRMSKNQSVPLEVYTEIPKLLDSGELIGIDVRSRAEVAVNPASKALNIPLGDIKSKIKELNKDKTYIIFCESGGRASFAIGQLKRAGIEKVYSLGTWRKWNEAINQNKNS